MFATGEILEAYFWGKASALPSMRPRGKPGDRLKAAGEVRVWQPDRPRHGKPSCRVDANRRAEDTACALRVKAWPRKESYYAQCKYLASAHSR